MIAAAVVVAVVVVVVVVAVVNRKQLSSMTNDGLFMRKGAQVVWIQPTTIIDGRLNTPEKQLFMKEAIVQQYR